MTTEPPRPGTEGDAFDATVASLAGEIERRPAIEVPVVPAARSRRAVAWLGGGLLALLIAAIEIGILLSADDRPAPPPPPAVTATLARDACMARLNTVLVAIERYTIERGRPPVQLAQLVPTYLAGEPVDPVTGRPLLYERAGESMVLSCPPPAPAAAAPEGA